MAEPTASLERLPQTPIGEDDSAGKNADQGIDQINGQGQRPDQRTSVSR